MLKKTFVIAKRQFLNFFIEPVGYVFFISFILTAYFLFFKNIFILGFSTIRPFVQNLPLLFAILIPALTMGSVSEEKGAGTVETVFTSPVSMVEFILGKVLGALFVYILLLGVTLSVPLSLLPFGSFDAGQIVSSYIGLVLLGGMLVSIGVFVSSLSENQVVSFIGSFALILAFILIGLDVVLLSLPLPLAELLRPLSIFGRLNSFYKGVIDARDVVYFLSFSALFMYFSFYVLSKKRFYKSRFTSYAFTSTFVALFAFVIAINMLTKGVFVRVDLTRDHVYTLSQSTKKIIKGLPQTAEIEVFYSKDLPPEFQERKQGLFDIVRDITQVPGAKLKVKYTEIVSGSDEEKRALSEGITPVQFNTISNDEFQSKMGYIGLLVSLGDKKEKIPFLQSSEGLEYQIATLVKKVSGAEKKKIAFADDGDSLGIYTDISDLRSELAKYYNTTSVSLGSQGDGADKADEEGTDPLEGVDVLAIAGPRSEIPEDVLNKILAFSQKGGSVVVFADSFDVDLQTLSPESNSLSINNVLSNYGITIERDIVFDTKYNERVSLNQGPFTYVLPYPYFVRAAVTDNGKNLLGNISSVLFPWPGSITLKEITGVRSDPLVVTSSFAVSDFGQSVKDGEEEKVQFNLVPNKNYSNEGAESKVLGVLSRFIDDTGMPKDSKLIVISNDDIIKNSYIKGNMAFIMNVFDLAANDSDFIAIRSKVSAPAPLRFKSDSEKNLVKYLNLGGVPFAIAVAGFLVLRLRSNGFKRKRSSS